MKILIVDDEMFVRIGIKTTLDWYKYGHEIVGEAEDGVEGIEMFNKYKPDIVLTDILMPAMNGLEFIRQVNKSNPFCRFIIMSCHNEFEYVREAMKLGVRDYIMKTTVKRDELLEIINKVSDEIKQEKIMADALNAEKMENFTNRHLIIREYMNRIIDELETNDGEISCKFNELQLELKVPNLYLILFSANCYRNDGKEFEPRHYDLLIHGITNIASEIFKQYAKAVVVKRNDKEVMVFINFDTMEDADITYKSLSDISNDVIKAVKEFLNIGISIGISPEISRFSDISNAYRKAASALERKFFVGPFNVIVYNDMYEADNSFKEKIVSLGQEILNAVKQMDFDKVDGFLEDIGSSDIVKSGTDTTFVKNTFLNLILNLIKHVEYEFLNKEEVSMIEFSPNEILKFEYFEDLLEHISRVIHEIMGVIENKFNMKYKFTINKLKEMLQRDSSEEISLNEAAEYVSLSPGYFSRLFKKLTGENFIDYLIKVKMEKAKSMIRNGEKLWMIAQKLGYTEVSSFSRIFKRMEGISPLQYRMKLGTFNHKKVEES